jgi:putative flippase GtrA
MKRHIKRTYHFAKKTAMEKSFRRYLFVGVSTVAIDYTLLYLLSSHLGKGIISAVTIAYWTAIIYNFLMNKYWTFEDKDNLSGVQLAKYLSLLIFNYLVTLGVVAGLQSAGISEYIAKFFALAFTISWTYFIYKKLVFSANPQNTESSF